jgi:hypothetical protein
MGYVRRFGRRFAEGIKEGIKLSTTAHLAGPQKPHEIRVLPRQRLVEPAWGPGGRRFKSCLPDFSVESRD